MKEQTRNTKVQINEEKIGKLPEKVPNRINPRRNMPRHILIKPTNTRHKERILKVAREKQHITYKGNPIHLAADLSAETLQTKRQWMDILKLMKIQHKQPILKTVREKQQLTHKGIPIRITADLSTEILQARRYGRMYLK